MRKFHSLVVMGMERMKMKNHDLVLNLDINGITFYFLLSKSVVVRNCLSIIVIWLKGKVQRYNLGMHRLCLDIANTVLV